MQSMISAGTQAFVDQSTDMIAVPNTTIVGRARIPNLANDLRASLGVERIPVQSIMQLQNEFGASGEPVFAAVNDDRGLIRFVGGWYNTVNVYGVGVTAPSSAPSSYVEVTFYGTGINLLFDGYSSSGYYPTIDGGTEQSVLAGPTSAVISGRNYSPNVVLTSSSCHGLSLGIHTVKFRNAVNVSLMGFEILNANASGYININTGTAYANGSKIVKSAASAIAYNTGVTGTKGGRVVRYLNSDGTVGQAFQAVNAAAAYLTSADHANEEVVRPYNCKEFGAGRADVFSLSFNSTARAFTLDDGTTTLVGNAVMGNDFITPVATNDFFVFTFVGTGLDITGRAAVTTPTLSTYVYSIDGGSEVSFPVASITAKKSFKVVSGLPYGTHTFKLKISALNSERMFWYDFIVYGPKKPTIPATAVELCDYNVMADFIQNTTAGLETIATGVLRKTCTRELVYTGTWLAIGSPAPVSYVGGFETAGNTINNTMSLRFFGTGIDLRFATAGNRATNVSVQFDDLAATTENFPSLVSNVYGGCAFSAGVLNQYDGAGFTGAGCRISGLPLGVHTVKFINNVALYFVINVIDIITPIHAVKSNLYADLQNTLPVGSCSLTDSRKTSMIKEILPAQKAWAQAVGLANATTSSTSFVPLADLSLTIKTSGGAIEVKTSVDLYLDASSWRGAIAIYVDGIKASGVVTGQSGTSAGAMHTMPFISAIVPVSAGVHKVDVYWRVEGGTTIYTYVDSTTNSRMLSVQEL